MEKQKRTKESWEGPKESIWTYPTLPDGIVHKGIAR